MRSTSIAHFPRSKSRSMSILPAFNIVGTTFTLYTLVKSGKFSPTAWTSLSYCLRDSVISRSCFVLLAIRFSPLLCFWDAIWLSKTFFLVPTLLDKPDRTIFYREILLRLRLHTIRRKNVLGVSSHCFCSSGWLTLNAPLSC